MILFPTAEPMSVGKQTQIWREKRSTLWAENEFFNSNMDALTVHTLYLGHCELGVQNCHQLWICGIVIASTKLFRFYYLVSLCVSESYVMKLYILAVIAIRKKKHFHSHLSCRC